MKKKLPQGYPHLSFLVFLFTFFSLQVLKAQCPANTWISRSTAVNIGWQSVTYGNGLFVAVAWTGSGNRVMTSPDGITWTNRSSAEDNSWFAVTYGNGLFVAVAQSGIGNRVMTSPDGITWTSRTAASDIGWNSVIYRNGLFVAVATSGFGNRVMTSPDGITWTSRSSAADNTWTSVTYGNGLFVAVAQSGIGNRVMTSPDGIVWTSRSSAADNNWQSVTYGNGLFVAVARSGIGNRVMTSPDGITWTSRTSAADNNWQSVTFGNGLFVVVANTGNGNRVMTSPDGITWTIRSSAANSNWQSVTFGNGVFVAVSNDGVGTSRVMTSSQPLVTPSVSIAANPSNSITTGTTVTFTASPTNGGSTPAYQWKKNGNNVGTNSVTYTDAGLEKGDIITCVLTSNDPCASPVSVTSSAITMSVIYPCPAGATWTNRSSAADNNWYSLTYGNGLFVVVSNTGTGNRVMTSPDGITWTSRTSAADNEWYYLTYGNGLFVAVATTGTGNRVMTSPDGIIWTSRSSAVDNQWQSVTYGNGLFVAVGSTGTGNRVMTSPDGITWTFRSSAADNLWRSIIYGNGVFVAVADNGTGNRVMTSSRPLVTPSVTIAANPDNSIAIGTSVTFTATPTNGGSTPAYQWKKNGSNVGSNSVTYTDAFLVNGDIIICVLTSNDPCASLVTATSTGITMAVNYTCPAGTNWTSRTSATDNDWRSVTYGNGLFVAVSNSGTGNRVMTSPDGITWTSRASAADNNWQSVTYGNDLFVAVAISGTGNRVMTSPDGINWTIRTSAADNSWTSVTYGNGLFVAVSQTGTGNRVMTSSNGITWTSRTSAANNQWTSVTYGNGLFVAVSNTGTGNRVMTSPDGITWTIRTSAVDNQWTSVTYGNGLFVAVSNTGTGNRVMTSPNGIAWTSRSSAVDNQWNSIAYGNGLFVALAISGTGNRVMTSPNGTTWTIRSSVADISWQSVTYSNDVFVAVALSGTGNRVMNSSPLYTTSTTNVSICSSELPYSWNGSRASAGTYTFTTTNSQGCDSIATLNLTVNAIPMIATITGTTSVCLANTTQLANTTNGGVWTSVSTGIAAVNSTGLVTGVSAGASIIRYTVTNGNGCVDSVETTVTILPVNTITLSSAVNTEAQSVCYNTALTNITYTTTAATGISNNGVSGANGLPAGVSATWSSNTITISGTPTASGTFNYTVPLLASGCGNLSATGIITVQASGTWTGASSTAWATPDNWCGTMIPALSTDVTIPSGVANYPNIGATSPVNNLTIASGASLTVTGLLQIGGSINNSGTLDLSSATLEMNGSAAQTIPSGSFVGKAIRNLIVNNSSGVDLGDSLKITGTLTPTDGTLTTNDKLVLKSTASGTARIAAGTGNYLSGAVTVERYISPKTARKYSFVAATTNQSIRNGWQNQIYITGAGTGGQTCGVGTGNGGATDRYNSNGFEKTQTNTPSMYTYNVTPGSNGSRWVTIANTTNTNLEAGRGYRVNIRGDRNVGTCADQLNSNTPTAPVAVTLQTTGAVSTGNVTVTLNNANTHLYTLLGNPYPSQISFTSLFAGNTNNINNKMWTYSPFGNGNYTTYSNGLIANGATGYDNTNGDFIASGQAFFVEAKTTGSGSVTFQEGHKASGTIPNTQYFGTANQQLIRIGLKTSGDSSLDEAVVRFNGFGAKNYLTDWDAISFGGAAQTVAIQKGSSRLAIATLPVSTTTDSILLTVKSSANGTFKLNFSHLDGLDSSRTYWLRDAYLNQSQNIRNNSSYAFNITADSLSKGDSRFLLIAKPSGTTLPVRFVALTAKATDRREALLNWEVADAKDVATYVVERSTNGVTFAPIATVKATNANQYSIKDAQLPENVEVVYYRIRTVETDGHKSYSNTVKLTTNHSPLITIYPNPAKGAFTVQLPSIATQQRYSVTVFSVEGKAVRTEQNLTPTDANTLRLTTKGLTSGVYQLKVHGENGAVWTVRLQVGD